MNSAGERLKKVRLEKGISLEEAQKKTKVHLNILKAIEGDSISNLSPVYLKGFLKIYCKFLGVDPQEYIPDYKENQASNKLGVLSQRQAPSLKIDALKPDSSRLIKKINSIIVFLLVVLIIGLVFFNVGKFITSIRKAHPRSKKAARVIKKPVAKSATKTKEAQEAYAKTAVVKPQEASSAAKKQISSGIRLGIRTRENCWVSLKADGKVVFQRVLEKGRFESWEAKDKMELSLGSAGAVELEVNGQLFSNLGKRGQALKNILITKDGLKTLR